MTERPAAAAVRQHLEGAAISLRGDDIDTDQIIPARFLKGITSGGLGEHAFADARQAARERGGLHPLDDLERQAARILLVNKNFGCGSSREHAPQALHRRGFTAVVGVSFGEIFAANCVAIGMPCVRVAEDDLARLQDAAEGDSSRLFAIDLDEKTIRSGNLVVPVELPEAARMQFLGGTWDATAALLEAGPAIERTASHLPYLNGWSDGGTSQR
jgi:3-isopropylmalate/(R)-2-methylmalate dehydratase small subunit